MKTRRLAPPTSHPLTALDSYVLSELQDLARPQLGLISIGRPQLAEALEITPAGLDSALKSLAASNWILCNAAEIGVVSQLSAHLNKERDRNAARIRTKSHIAPDWTLHRRFVRAFPRFFIRTTRSRAYNRPLAFKSLLEIHPHSHLDSRPAEVEIFAGPYYAAELADLLQVIADQQAARRTVHLLFTRKSIYLGIRRTPIAPK